jgi:hypothetical protein
MEAKRTVGGRGHPAGLGPFQKAALSGYVAPESGESRFQILAGRVLVAAEFL